MGLGGGGGGLAGAAQIFFDGVDHVLLSGAELFASVDEPPSDGQDAPPGCICSAPRMSDSRFLRYTVMRPSCAASETYAVTRQEPSSSWIVFAWTLWGTSASCPFKRLSDMSVGMAVATPP